MTDNPTVVGVVKASMADIKENTFSAARRCREPDGTQKAMEVHIFPEKARRGRRLPAVQCARQHDDQRERRATVKGTDGQTMRVKYKDGEKKIVVPPNTPIVTFVASDKSEIKPGVKLIIFGAAKKRMARSRQTASTSAGTA